MLVVPELPDGFPEEGLSMLVLSRRFVPFLCALAWGATALAQDRPVYRGFELGATVQAVAALSGATPVEVKTLHQRPALIQALTWHPPYAMGGPSASRRDPVRQIDFTFYDDQLFRIVVDYDRDRTAGLTAEDLIHAMEAIYGPPEVADEGIGPGSLLETDGGGGRPVATWSGNDQTVVLYQSPGFSGRANTSHFVMVVTSPQLLSMSRAAIAQAMRMDSSEAPQRELDRQQKEAEADRSSAEKARQANKPAFTP